MLLVKSRESKSCGKNTIKTECWVSFTLFSLVPSAQAAPTSITSPTSVASIFLSLLLVVAVIFLLAYLMRRFNVTTAGQGQLKVVASLMTGNKEKVMVIQVGDEQHLIGVTSHTISHLSHLATPLATTPLSSAVPGSFAGVLQNVLQGKTTSADKRPQHDK